MNVETESLPQVLIAIAAVLVYVLLAIRRYKFYRWNAPTSARRLFMVDVLLVLAAIEILLDTIADAAGTDTTLGGTAFVLAVCIRGSLVAGGLALLISFR